MNLREKLADTHATMRELKEKHVSENPSDTDIPIYLHCWRGDDVVVMLQCPVDRDTALMAAHLAAPGFGCNVIAISFESYHTTLPHSPVTGEMWRPREMQFVFETDPLARDKGWVTECISTTIYERDGECLMSSVGYFMKEGLVQWLEDDVFPELSSDPVTIEGHMHDALQAAMAQPTMLSRMTDPDDQMGKVGSVLAAGMEVERQQFHIDMACLNALSEKHLITAASLGADEGSLREQLLAERLGPSTDGWTFEKI